jgi:hypothetical protein
MQCFQKILLVEGAPVSMAPEHVEDGGREDEVLDRVEPEDDDGPLEAPHTLGKPVEGRVDELQDLGGDDLVLRDDVAHGRDRRIGGLQELAQLRVDDRQRGDLVQRADDSFDVLGVHGLSVSSVPVASGASSYDSIACLIFSLLAMR